MRKKMMTSLSEACSMANVEMNELHQNKKFQTGVSIATFGAALMSRIALAGGAEQLFELFITIAGGIVVVVGVILAIIGLISYAIAMSDGDGPAKKKAAMEIGSGIALLTLSVTLIANKSNFSSLITAS